MEQTKPKETPKAPRHRSPAYPAISLRKALERAREFYAVQRQHSAPVEAAVGVWEFAAKSSGGTQTISALKQYGLMSESEKGESRQVQLSDLALRIIRDERDPSPERDAATRKAALLPKIHAEMWAKWGVNLPVDATVRFFLIQDKKYNEASVADLIATYKDTIAFAKLSDSDKVRPAEGESEEEERAEVKRPVEAAPPPKGAKLMEGERELTTGLLSKTASFRLIVSGDVGVKEIERLIAKLKLDKEILAEPDTGDNGTSDE